MKHGENKRYQRLPFKQNESKSEFLRCFWDERGTVIWKTSTDNKGCKKIIRLLEAFNDGVWVSTPLIRLHEKLGITARLVGRKIIIGGKENLQKFLDLVNFSHDTVVAKSELFSGFKKREVLKWMIESFNDLTRIYIKSFGCPTNVSDGERIAGCLSEVGYEIVKNAGDAEVLIYNTCAVKTPTEDKIIQILRRVSKDKKLIVTGCLPLINLNRLKSEVEFDSILGPSPDTKTIEAVHKISQGKKVVAIKKSDKPSLDLPKIPVNKVVSIVPINYGCLGSCSYCCVHFARGKVRSCSIPDIIRSIKRDLATGAKEIWITSQDTASYGKDIDTNLANLIREVCKVPRKFFVRIGMMNPSGVFEILDELIKVFKDNKVFKFLHLPVQSGDNKILSLMKRLYSVDDFKEIVNSFRKEIPRITISTDIICGFTGESDKDFEQSMRLLKEIKPDVLNISKFFPRPKTQVEI